MVLDWIIIGILIAIGIYIAPIVIGIALLALGIVVSVIIEAINLLKGDNRWIKMELAFIMKL